MLPMTIGGSLAPQPAGEPPGTAGAPGAPGVGAPGLDDWPPPPAGLCPGLAGPPEGAAEAADFWAGVAAGHGRERAQRKEGRPPDDPRPDHSHARSGAAVTVPRSAHSPAPPSACR